MNAPATHAIEFAETEIAGALLAMLVIQLEQQKNPWVMTSEKNQEIFLNKARESIGIAVKRAVMTIATNRMPAVAVTLANVKFDGDGVEGKITMPKTIHSHDLADAAGQKAYILLANPESFTAGTEKVAAAKDQPELPLEAAPEIKKMKDGSFTVYKDNVPMPEGKGFKTMKAAEEWLKKLNAGVAPAGDAAPAADAAPGQLPEIVKRKAGGFQIVIGEDKHRFVGHPKKPFKTHAAAEKWLQEHLGVLAKKEEKKPKGGVKDDAPPPPEGWPFPPLNHGLDLPAEAPAPPAPAPAPVPEPNLEEAMAAFKAAGVASAKKEGADFETELAEIRKRYPPDFIEENLSELDTAFADGYDSGLGN